jgi:hypothetical protein
VRTEQQHCQRLGLVGLLQVGKAPHHRAHECPHLHWPLPETKLVSCSRMMMMIVMMTIMMAIVMMMTTMKTLLLPIIIIIALVVPMTIPRPPRLRC